MAPTFFHSGPSHSVRRWAERLAIRLGCWLCLLSGVLLSAGGCGERPPHEVDYGEVSGKVSFKGKPLPGGKVTFVTAKWGYSASANIDENGQYNGKFPVGDVLIAVDNRMLEPPKKEKGKKQAAKNPPLKAPPDVVAPPPPKGKYVKIPDKYADPSTSGLTFKVEKGTQTHDIKLD